MRILLVLIILIGGAILVYQLTRAIFPATSGEEAIVVQAPQPAPTIVIPEWKVFANPQFRYTLQYPPDTDPYVNPPSDVYTHFVTFAKVVTDEVTEETTREERFSLSVRTSTLEKEIQFQKSRIDGHILMTLTSQVSFSHHGLSASRLDYVSATGSGELLTLVSVAKPPRVFTLYFPKLKNSQFVNDVISTFTLQ